MKVLVTGGAGYIGSHTIIALHEMGYRSIVSADNYLNSDEKEYQKIASIIGMEISYYEIDLCDARATLDLFEKENFDGVIHFAALKSVPESVEMPTFYYQNNLGALTNLLDAMKANAVNRLIFSSSCSIFGNPEVLPVSEDTPFGEAESPYAHTKQIGEKIIEAHCKTQSSLKALALRYFNPAGAHPSGKIGEVKTKRPNNLVPIIAQNAAGVRDQFAIFGEDYPTKDGTCVRDYIHVSDIANAHVLGLAYLDDMDQQFDTFNLGSGEGSTTLEVVKEFEKLEGVQLNYSLGPRRAGDVAIIYADNKKAKEVLKWNPVHGLDTIVSSAWKWQQNA